MELGREDATSFGGLLIGVRARLSDWFAGYEHLQNNRFFFLKGIDGGWEANKPQSKLMILNPHPLVLLNLHQHSDLFLNSPNVF